MPSPTSRTKQVRTFLLPSRPSLSPDSPLTRLSRLPVCVVDKVIYRDGDPIPTDDACESCRCRPPGFACVLRECEVKAGCKAIRREGQCCPEYQCGRYQSFRPSSRRLTSGRLQDASTMAASSTTETGYRTRKVLVTHATVKAVPSRVPLQTVSSGSTVNRSTCQASAVPATTTVPQTLRAAPRPLVPRQPFCLRTPLLRLSSSLRPSQQHTLPPLLSPHPLPTRTSRPALPS